MEQYYKRPTVVTVYIWQGEFTKEIISYLRRLEEKDCYVSAFDSFVNPLSFCPYCNHPFLEHGFIRESREIVCPNDYIAIEGEEMHSVSPSVFNRDFVKINKVEDEQSNSG